MPLRAGIFDLDGVITDTATLHFMAWKALFDKYLKARSNTFHEFTHDDYLNFVDGMPRYDGVRKFLASRDIQIPEGTPEDDSGQETVCGLGNQKNHEFVEMLQRQAPKVFDTTIQLIQRLRKEGIKTGVISSSEHCGVILKQVALDDLFDTQVEGQLSKKLGLPGKPDPAIFLEAAKRLDVTPETAFIVEDAIAGVQAGKAGGFKLVIGIDRKGTVRSAMQDKGANVVVSDLGEITLAEIKGYFQ